MKKHRTVVTLGLCAFAAGCATSHTGTRVENLAPSSYSISELIVVAFTDDADARREFETGFAGRFTELSAETGVSYEAMPDLSGLDDDGSLQRAKARTGADTSVLVEIIKEDTAARGTRDALFGVWVAGLLTGSSELRRAGARGGAAATTAAASYEFRITLWHMADDSLLWTMDTDSFVVDLSSTSNSGAKLADTVHAELASSGLVRN